MTHEARIKAQRIMDSRLAQRNNDASQRLAEYKELSANPTDSNFGRRCELLIEGIMPLVYPSYLENVHGR